MTPDLLKKEAYHFELPPRLIAQYPAKKRDESRLLQLTAGAQSPVHGQFRDLLQLLRPDDLLVLNNSRVIPARLFGEKDSGGRVEILLLHPAEEADTWYCLAYPGKRLKSAQWLHFSPNFRGYIHPAGHDGNRKIRLQYEGELFDNLAEVGHIPLPPYIERPDEKEDKERYQTVYAIRDGSVAAPTAGLHFTDLLLGEIKAKGIETAELTLHVGIGTFRPVKTEYIQQHQMHAELCEISPSVAGQINRAKREKRRIVCVGTTSVRSLESFASGGRLESGRKWTDIFIYPGYKFQLTDAIITNFHLPQSTLLMMIAAFAGYEKIMEAYKEAVALKYRFFSYGDAMYIEA